MYENVTAEQQRKTRKGMAHWAGTGPAGKTCRECAKWAGSDDDRYAAAKSKELKPAPCQIYLQKMGGPHQKVPHGAAACKYYEENPAPPRAFG